MQTHVTANSGKAGPNEWLSKKKNKDMFHHIHTTHPYYQIVGKTHCGGTVRDICNSLPSRQEDYDKYDCVIIVVNMNLDPSKKGSKVWQDDSDLGVDFMQLCIALRPYKRALIIGGGSGLMWNLPPRAAERWDYMTSQMICIANTVGVIATNGMR